MVTSIGGCRPSVAVHHPRPSSVSKAGASKLMPSPAARDRPCAHGLHLGAQRSRRTGSCVKASPEDEPGVEAETAPEAMFMEVEEVEKEPLASESTTETLGEVLRKRRAKGSASSLSPAKESDSASDSALVDIINPYIIGRKSRAVFDDAWSKLSRLSNAGSGGSFMSSKDFYDDGELELEAPQAAYTTVLVVGATGRVGRIVLRKLLLRGYTVKVLSRNEEVEFPTSVEVVRGDVGDYASVREAVKNVDKVVYCATARSTFTADVNRVEYTGVANLVRALQDQYNIRAIAGGKSRSSRAKVTVADFKRELDCDKWQLEHVGYSGEGAAGRVFDRGQDYGSLQPTEGNNLRFEGAIYSRSGYGEFGGSIDGEELKNTESLLARLVGDGNTYTCILTTMSGAKYSSRFNTTVGYNTVRLPYNTFRPLDFNDPPVDPEEIQHMSFKFEPRRGGGGASGFKIELDWIKALPGGEEPDFVLISRDATSAGNKPKNDTEEMQLKKVLDFKLKGEAALRNSGLGYTIIRPGRLIEEPGGYRALVFDQGGRALNTVSCADVADVCVKGLHEISARCMTFQVCHEFMSAEGLEQYELIAHLPDKSSNYVATALPNLQRLT